MKTHLLLNITRKLVNSQTLLVVETNRQDNVGIIV